jgi:hypothetical protein
LFVVFVWQVMGQGQAPGGGIFLTPVQQLLHDQLLQKSEQLQDTIRRQQEELRQITQQLAHTQPRPGQQPTPQQQQHQQQQQQQQQQANLMALQNQGMHGFCAGFVK